MNNFIISILLCLAQATASDHDSFDQESFNQEKQSHKESDNRELAIKQASDINKERYAKFRSHLMKLNLQNVHQKRVFCDKKKPPCGNSSCEPCCSRESLYKRKQQSHKSMDDFLRKQAAIKSLVCFLS
jgi:hypothetical protein